MFKNFDTNTFQEKDNENHPHRKRFVAMERKYNQSLESSSSKTSTDFIQQFYLDSFGLNNMIKKPPQEKILSLRTINKKIIYFSSKETDKNNNFKNKLSIVIHFLR